MSRYVYEPVDSKTTLSMSHVLILGIVATASAVATGSAVASYTSMHITATQSAVGTGVVNRISLPPSGRVASVQLQAEKDSSAPVDVFSSVLGQESAAFKLLAPLSAVLMGFAVYLARLAQPAPNSWAMATTDEEAKKDESALVGKSYKSTSRADSYYGKPEGVTVEQVNPMKNTYKPPVGAYDAPSEKKYTPTTSSTSSYYGQSQETKTSAPTYTPPVGGYSATNNKNYVPTTIKEQSYYGKDQGATVQPKAAMWYGPDRPKWLGPQTSPQLVPDYLKGELPGDYGFDTASLGSDPARLARYQEAELMNGRWAMLGALGCVFPEFIAKFCGYGVEEPVWFKAGAVIFKNANTDVGNGVYMQSIFGQANSGAGIPINPVFVLLCQLVFMGLVEGFRASRITGRDALYPGKFFDPLGLANDPDDFAELKVKEIKNGRLAMLAMLGFFVQSAVTNQGPVQNLLDHLSDPLRINGFSQTYATVFTPGA